MADAENDPDRYAGVATAANGIRDLLRRANGNSDVRAALKNKNWAVHTAGIHISDSMVRKMRSGSITELRTQSGGIDHGKCLDSA